MRRRSLLISAAAALLVGGLGWSGPAVADTSPGPTITGHCQPEHFPHAGAPRNAPSTPYEIPFTATLGPDPENALIPNQGGWLEIRGSSRLLLGARVVLILGGPVIGGKGSVYAQGCGLVQLPSEVGGLGADAYGAPGVGGQVNPNFVFAPATPVSIGLSLPGIGLSPNVVSPLVAYSSADGFASASIELKPAANGGLNVNFFATAKSTSNLSYLLSLLGTSVAGQDCTVTIGDLAAAGLAVPAGGIDGLTHSEATTPVHLSTTQSVPDPLTGLPDPGRPVTGPIAPDSAGHAQDSAVLAANDFPVAAIDPNMPPSPGFPGPATCTASNANLLNSLIGLPNPAGNNFFYAPGTFGVFTSS